MHKLVYKTYNLDHICSFVLVMEVITAIVIGYVEWFRLRMYKWCCCFSCCYSDSDSSPSEVETERKAETSKDKVCSTGTKEYLEYFD